MPISLSPKIKIQEEVRDIVNPPKIIVKEKVVTKEIKKGNDAEKCQRYISIVAKYKKRIPKYEKRIIRYEKKQKRFEKKLKEVKILQIRKNSLIRLKGIKKGLNAMIKVEKV